VVDWWWESAVSPPVSSEKGVHRGSRRISLTQSWDRSPLQSAPGPSRIARAVFLGSENVNLSQSKLSEDRMVDVDIEIERDGHATSLIR
jgi:hypothetical protein